MIEKVPEHNIVHNFIAAGKAGELSRDCIKDMILVEQKALIDFFEEKLSEQVVLVVHNDGFEKEYVSFEKIEEAETFVEEHSYENEEDEVFQVLCYSQILDLEEVLKIEKENLISFEKMKLN